MDDEEDEEADSEEMAEVVEAAEPKKQPAKAEPKKEEKKRKAEDTEKESPANKKAKADKKDKKIARNYETIEDVKKAIIANPGGKPKKEEKFGNWVKNTMKCTNEDWIKDLWTWHKTENKL